MERLLEMSKFLSPDDVVEYASATPLFLVFEDGHVQNIEKAIDLRWAALKLQEAKQKVRVGVIVDNVTRLSKPISGVKLQYIWYKIFWKGKWFDDGP